MTPIVPGYQHGVAPVTYGDPVEITKLTWWEDDLDALPSRSVWALCFDIENKDKTRIDESLSVNL